MSERYEYGFSFFDEDSDDEKGFSLPRWIWKIITTTVILWGMSDKDREF